MEILLMIADNEKDLLAGQETPCHFPNVKAAPDIHLH